MVGDRCSFLCNIAKDLHLSDNLIAHLTTIYNDDTTAVQWSCKKTPKNIRYLQILKNAVRKSVQNNIVTIKHVDGKMNLTNIFT